MPANWRWQLKSLSGQSSDNDMDDTGQFLPGLRGLHGGFPDLSFVQAVKVTMFKCLRMVAMKNRRDGDFPQRPNRDELLKACQ